MQGIRRDKGDKGRWGLGATPRRPRSRRYTTAVSTYESGAHASVLVARK